MLPVRSVLPARCRAEVKFDACCPGGETEVCRVAISMGVVVLIVIVSPARKKNRVERKEGNKDRESVFKKEVMESVLGSVLGVMNGKVTTTRPFYLSDPRNSKPKREGSCDERAESRLKGDKDVQVEWSSERRRR